MSQISNELIETAISDLNSLRLLSKQICTFQDCEKRFRIFINNICKDRSLMCQKYIVIPEETLK